MPRRSAVNLHIGLEKTGTTALQAFLFANADALESAGITYPLLAGQISHFPLAAASIDLSRRTDVHEWCEIDSRNAQQVLREDLAGQLAALSGPGRRIVLCSEHLSSRVVDDADLGRLADFFSDLGLTVGVTVYLRRQECFIESTFSTALKAGLPMTSSLMYSGGVDTRYDYPLILSQWRDAFGGRVTPRVYREEWKTQSSALFRHFTQLLGIEWRDDFTVPEGLANPALGRADLETLQAINRLAQMRPDACWQGLREDFFREAEAALPLVPFRLSADERWGIHDTYLDSNRRLKGLIPAGDLAYLVAPPAAPRVAWDEEAVVEDRARSLARLLDVHERLLRRTDRAEGEP